MAEFSSPLGFTVRGPDNYGSGAYGASRDGGARKHLGLDIIAPAGWPLVMPAPFKVVRPVRPYADDDTLSGVLLEALDGMQVKILYMAPITTMMGQFWPRGTLIGHAQSLQHRYPGITNHCHFEVWLHGERVDPGPYFGIAA